MGLSVPLVRANIGGFFRGILGRITDVLRREDVRLHFIRWLFVGCQGAILWISWPLWQVHRSPPMLPALPLPYFDMGVILLLSLVLILVKPLLGVVVHTGLIFYAVLIDQTRMQPEIVSLVFLLWGTVLDSNARMIGRTHLLSLWMWAGANKLLSPAFMHGTAQWMLTGLIHQPPIWLRDNAGYFIALTEFSTGFLALFPRTRKIAGVMALGLHIGILLDLSPLGHNWNRSVWPWNLALAFAGLILIFPWRESTGASLRACRPLVRALAIVLLLAPAGFYFGLTDAYLAHNLYSSNAPTANSTALSPGQTWTAFNVPLPPEHRLFEEYFRLTCALGDTLTIHDSRWWFRQQGMEQSHFVCPTDP
jgi:hypothetical protein